MVDGLSETALRERRVDGLVRPGLELCEQPDRSLLSRPPPLLIGEVLDPPLDTQERLVEGLTGGGRMFSPGVIPKSPRWIEDRMDSPRAAAPRRFTGRNTGCILRPDRRRIST